MEDNGSDLSSLAARTDSFVHVLIHDVASSLDALKSSDTPTLRRSAIRTVFASIEGLMHLTRGCLSVFPLTPAELTVVNELSYEVTDRGTINERTRFVPFDRSLKAIVRIVRQYCSEYSLDFDHPGWIALLRTLDVRHRLTHPKSLDDLSVTDSEIEDAHRGFYWFLAFAIEVMNEGVESIRDKFGELIDDDSQLSKALKALEE